MKIINRSPADGEINVMLSIFVCKPRAGSSENNLLIIVISFEALRVLVIGEFVVVKTWGL